MYTTSRMIEHMRESMSESPTFSIVFVWSSNAGMRSVIMPNMSREIDALTCKHQMAEHSPPI